MQLSDLPIGFFDSGVGGLSVMRHAMDVLPGESFIYYGDDLNAPYGSKNEAEIKELSTACGSFLYNKGVKAIVMACNTATSAAVKHIRELYNIPVISIEPAVKPAYEHLNGGRILVLATEATLSQSRYRELLTKVGCEQYVANMPCSGLVELLEDGDFASPRISDYLEKKFAPLKGERFDGIVIGCTHYSFITDTIKSMADRYFTGDRLIYDGMYGTVRQLDRVLQQRGIKKEDMPQGGRTIELYSSKPGSVPVLSRILYGEKRL